MTALGKLAACVSSGIRCVTVPRLARIYGGGAVVLPDLLVRGRWAADASGRHYIQSGRQMLLALALPAEIAMMARALRAVGIAALASPDFRSRLAQNM